MTIYPTGGGGAGDVEGLPSYINIITSDADLPAELQDGQEYWHVNSFTQLTTRTIASGASVTISHAEDVIISWAGGAGTYAFDINEATLINFEKVNYLGDGVGNFLRANNASQAIATSIIFNNADFGNFANTFDLQQINTIASIAMSITDIAIGGTGIKINGANVVSLGNTIITTIGGAGTIAIRLEGVILSLSINNGNHFLSVGEYLLSIAADMFSLSTSIINNQYVNGGSNSLFLVTKKSITAFADNGVGIVRVTSATHGLSSGNTVFITGANDYRNKPYTITVIDVNQFDLDDEPFVAGGTGKWQDAIDETVDFNSDDLLYGVMTVLNNGDQSEGRVVSTPSFSNNVLTTVITGTSWSVVNGTYIPVGVGLAQCQRFSTFSNGKIICNSVKKGALRISSTITGKANSGGAKDYEFTWQKNGTPLTDWIVLRSFDSSQAGNVSLIIFVEYELDDVFELVVRQVSTAGDFDASTLRTIFLGV